MLGEDSVKCIPLFFARQRLGKDVSLKRKIVGGNVFHAVPVVPKENRRLALPITSYHKWELQLLTSTLQEVPLHPTVYLKVSALGLGSLTCVFERF
jgi:hypothetical protein